MVFLDQRFFCLHTTTIFSSPILQLKYYVSKHVSEWTDVKYNIVILMTYIKSWYYKLWF